jgi:hypothetical protein
MIASDLKMGVEQTLETLCVTNIDLPQTVGSVEHLLKYITSQKTIICVLVAVRISNISSGKVAQHEDLFYLTRQKVIQSVNYFANM